MFFVQYSLHSNNMSSTKGWILWGTPKVAKSTVEILKEVQQLSYDLFIINLIWK